MRHTLHASLRCVKSDERNEWRVWCIVKFLSSPPPPLKCLRSLIHWPFPPPPPLPPPQFKINVERIHAEFAALLATEEQWGTNWRQLAGRLKDDDE